MTLAPQQEEPEVLMLFSSTANEKQGSRETGQREMRSWREKLPHLLSVFPSRGFPHRVSPVGRSWHCVVMNHVQLCHEFPRTRTKSHSIHL